MKTELLKDILKAESYIYNDNIITSGYVGDIYSQILKTKKTIDVWFTQKNHINAIAIAVKKGISNIVFCDYDNIDKINIEKAKEYRINLHFTKCLVYECLELFFMHK